MIDIYLPIGRRMLLALSAHFIRQLCPEVPGFINGDPNVFDQRLQPGVVAGFPVVFVIPEPVPAVSPGILLPTVSVTVGG